MPKYRNPTVTVSLPMPLIVMADDAAGVMGVSRSAFFRTAITEFLECNAFPESGSSEVPEDTRPEPTDAYAPSGLDEFRAHD